MRNAEFGGHKLRNWSVVLELVAFSWEQGVSVAGHLHSGDVVVLVRALAPNTRVDASVSAGMSVQK